MIKRRTIVSALATTPMWALIGAHGIKAQDMPTLSLTPQCADDDDLTPQTSAGPFFTPDSPNRSDLTQDHAGGQVLVVQGLVLDRQCRPFSGALVDVWQADQNGEYDNIGFRLRGHQITDSLGQWRFRTIVPAIYTGRTRHIHFRVQRPGGELLTTQVYFPDEAANAADRQFDESLLLRFESPQDANTARYDFVVS